MDGILRHVLQCVVHPAHVPFHAEAKAAQVGRTRDHRPGRGFLGDGLRIRTLLVDLDIEPAQEVDRFEVLAPTELVGDPLSLLARVVEIQHRGDPVDSQGVGVVAVEPGQSAAHQEASHLVAAVVENRAAPVWVQSKARVRMLE